jgi:predicted nucleic acid-binding protein
MIVYFDTSALLKRYLRETGSDEVNALLGEDHIFGSLAVTQVEMSAAIQKAVRMDVVSSKLAKEIWKDFLEDWEAFTRLRVTAATIQKASDIAWKYGLRGYDSLHLAAAMLWQENLGMKLTFAAFDHDLWLAGNKADLESWPSDLVSL